MLKYIRKEANELKRTFTENGAATLESTGSACLDLFATIGALRKADESEILDRFVRAFYEERDIAMKILFYGRDVTEGLGERRVFRTILRWLAFNAKDTVVKNLDNVQEYGRYDDLLTLLDTPCENEAIEYIRRTFAQDMENLKIGYPVSLLGKWLPSVNASNSKTVNKAVKIAKALGLSNAEYRRSLSALRKKIRIVENNLRESDYSFEYDAIPSRASYKYRDAFIRNDGERYKEYISKVSSGKAYMNMSNVSPYELIQPYLYALNYRNNKSYMSVLTPDEEKFLNAAWKSLPDFGTRENALAVIDTSGSMYFQNKPLPAAVALSLGLYFAERNKGAFANCFIEFSDIPQLIEIKGKTFTDRLRYAASFSRVANTNLEAVFDLVLRAAVKNRVRAKDMPKKLVIISDMEFDMCINNSSMTVYENAKRNYEYYGYTLPQIVFWNVASRNRQQPVSMDEKGTILVSGATPKLFRMIAGGETSPYKFMMEVLESRRYAPIVA